jgi:hypothetical protein
VLLLLYAIARTNQTEMKVPERIKELVRPGDPAAIAKLTVERGIENKGKVGYSRTAVAYIIAGERGTTAEMVELIVMYFVERRANEKEAQIKINQLTKSLI